MTYEIVLNDGRAIECWTEEENLSDVVKMMFEHTIYIVRENEHPNMASYILPEKVSHFRFPVGNAHTATPF